MKSFRETIRRSRRRTHQSVREWLRPKLGSLGYRYRLAGRIRLANVWARKHPKRTFGYVTGSLLFLLAVNIALDNRIVPQSEVNFRYTGPNESSSIALVDPMFEGFRTIQANKTAHRGSLVKLVAKGQALHEELDSLIALPHKTHMDSIHIIRNYRKLESIVKSLKNNDHP